RHQPTQRPDLSSEEVSGDQYIQMRTNKLLPRGGRLALWRRRDAMSLQDIAHGLVTDGVPEVGQGADDPVIAPGAVLLGHADDQRLQLRVDAGATRSLALLRAVKLLGHELTVPAKNRVRLDDRGHVLEGFLAQFLTNLGQGLAFTIRQP